MGQLFQPTNMIPNLMGEMGEGVADVSQPCEISWQVNGTTGMTKFRIRMYANAMGITGYHDEEVELPDPFYGRNENGEVVRIGYIIPEPWRYWENGKDCYYDLTLWWGSSDAQSITTLSRCVFKARRTPTLTLNIPSPQTSRTLDISATYTQAQGDGIMWAQWQLADNSSGTYDVIYDTGRMYGAMPGQGGELSFSYDGLISGSYYALNCAVQTENGVTVSSGWKQFEVEYGNIIEATGLEVANSCASTGAVSVRWPAYSYIPRTSSTGSGTIVGNQIVMSAGDSMRWENQDGGSMTLPPPWTLIYRGVYPNAAGGSVRLYFSASENHYLQILFRSDSGGIGFDVDYNITDPINTITVAKVRGLKVGSYFTVAVTPASVYAYSDREEWNISLAQRAFSNQAVKRVVLDGAQRTNLVKISSGGLSFSEFLKGYAQKSIAEIGEWTGGTWFRLYPVNGYHAGLNTSGAPYVNGYALYRIDEKSKAMTKIVESTRYVVAALDYGAGNLDKKVSYRVFETLKDGTIRLLQSEAITPCYWSWVLLSCTKNVVDAYIVQKAYAFQNNVSSSPMSNNNRPNVLDNFTRYPLVQMSNNNYRSGTLQSLIGTVSDAEYKDTAELRNEIMSLATTTNYLFIKDRKGDLMMIRPSGDITMETGDNTKEQEQTVSFPWVEVGSTEGVSIYGLG